MLPSDVNLPFPAWRSGQEKLLQRLILSDKKIILLEAPTGAGKSAVAASLTRWLGVKGVFLTSTKALQDQYAEAIPDMLPAKGRDNFDCNKQPWLTAKHAICTHGMRCPLVRSPGCTYYGQKMAAEESERAVLNYQYWLAQANYNGEFTPVDLLVCDEAHLVEDEIRRFVEVEVRKATLSTLRLKPPRDLNIPGWREWAAANAVDIPMKIEKLDHAGTTYQKARELDSARFSIQHDINDATWTYQEEWYRYVFKPAWIETFAREKLLRHAEKTIFMSATILDADAFCANLGIDPADTEFIRVGSTFPAGRRPLYYDPVGKVSANADLGPLVRRVDSILDGHTGRGLVHTANYKIAQYIAAHSRHHARLITHNTKTRGASILALQSTPGAVLVSPSMTTGLDLPYELCEFQIICKLQFPDLTDPQVDKRRRKTKGDKWYIWTTACSLVQAYGRGMRAPDDNCVTYLLDGNFGAWFHASVKDMLPGWFKEAIRWPKGEGAPDVSIDEQLRRIREQKD